MLRRILVSCRQDVSDLPTILLIFSLVKISRQEFGMSSSPPRTFCSCRTAPLPESCTSIMLRTPVKLIVFSCSSTSSFFTCLPTLVCLSSVAVDDHSNPSRGHLSQIIYSGAVDGNLGGRPSLSQIIHTRKELEHHFFTELHIPFSNATRPPIFACHNFVQQRMVSIAKRADLYD
jgi:hypothetical protein